MTASNVEGLVCLLKEKGGSAYFGEPISAALLHDLGHMLPGLDEHIAHRGHDGMHEELAAVYLARRFGEDVTAPIRLHLPAKRFLCWQDPEYLRQSLALPMYGEQAAVFMRNPFANAAIALRHRDDEAKVPGLRVPDSPRFCSLKRD